MKTLNAAEAAKFLNIDIDNLRQRTKAKEIPGAKVGRAYVYVDVDLVQYVRTRYARHLDSEGAPWGSTEEKLRIAIGPSPVSRARAYERALALPPTKKRSRRRLAASADSGKKPDSA